MRKNLCVVALVVLLGAFAAPASALAGDIWHSSGQNAYADFWALDPGNSCLSIQVSVSVNSGKTQSPPGRGSSGTQAWIYFSVYDNCSWTTVKGGSGYAEIADQDFKISGSVAKLTTTIQVYDWYNGSQYPVTIDLTWKATGPATRQSYQNHVHFPGYNYNYRSSGTYRSAEATGTVSDGTSNLTPEASFNGQFGTGRTMQTLVQ